MLIIWYEADTMKTVGKVIDHFRRLHVGKSKTPNHTHLNLHLTSEGGAAFVENTMLHGDLMLHSDPIECLGQRAVIRVDEIGVRRGVSDRLKEAEYPCIPFNASRRPTNESN